MIPPLSERGIVSYSGEVFGQLEESEFKKAADRILKYYRERKETALADFLENRPATVLTFENHPYLKSVVFHGLSDIYPHGTNPVYTTASGYTQDLIIEFVTPETSKEGYSHEVLKIPDTIPIRLPVSPVTHMPIEMKTYMEDRSFFGWDPVVEVDSSIGTQTSGWHQITEADIQVFSRSLLTELPEGVQLNPTKLIVFAITPTQDPYRFKRKQT